MPETISVQDTGKEFKVEAKYSLQDLGTENEDLKNRINKKVEDLMGSKVKEFELKPIKKYLLLEDRNAMKAKLEEYATTMDALVKSHMDTMRGLKGIVDYEVMQLGETLEKELKVALNAKVGEVVSSAEKRGIGEVVGGGAKEATKSYAQKLEDAANAK